MSQYHSLFTMSELVVDAEMVTFVLCGGVCWCVTGVIVTDLGRLVECWMMTAGGCGGRVSFGVVYA